MYIFQDRVHWSKIQYILMRHVALKKKIPFSFCIVLPWNNNNRLLFDYYDYCTFMISMCFAQSIKSNYNLVIKFLLKSNDNSFQHFQPLLLIERYTLPWNIRKTKFVLSLHFCSTYFSYKRNQLKNEGKHLVSKSFSHIPFHEVNEY